MWSNPEWAQRHISKKHPNVSIQDAWEACFDDPNPVLLSPDQLNYPPFRRFWKIGLSKKGLVLLVVFETWHETKNLITAFEPDQGIRRIYEKKRKTKR